MKKGFTLIELLAVIVILAIILLIATPIVIRVVESVKQDAFNTSAKMIMKAAEFEYAESSVSGNLQTVEYTFTSGIQTSSVPEKKLEFRGKVPENGKVIVFENGDINMAIHDGKYCVYTEMDKTKIEELTNEDCESKITSVTLPDTPEITYINNPEDLDYPISATPCTINDNEFTHILDKRDNQTYAVTEIGTQCWFSDNLAYTTQACLEAVWDGVAPHDACRVNGGVSWNKDEVLYQFAAATNGSLVEGVQGMCPTGWHIATDNEWKILEMHLGMTQIQADATLWRGTTQAQQLKSIDPSWSGTNTVGFNAKPSGHRNTSGSLQGFTTDGAWWASASSATYAWRRYLTTTFTSVYRSEAPQSFGNSIRCLLGE